MSRSAAVAAAILSLVVAALLGSADGAAAPAQNPKLFGTVGPEMSIILRDAQGNRVTRLDPGTYDIEVRDLSDEHNFHLRGPGVNRLTAVEGTGTESWTVTFTDGNYTYFCDPHPTDMRGTFTAGNPPTTNPPTTNPPAQSVVTARTRLVLTSGPGETITLRTAGGRTVRQVRRGTYRITVRDRSRIHNAHLIAPGFNRKTTLPFVGTQTWRVPLRRLGTLRFVCDPHAIVGMRGSAKIVR